VKDLGLDEQFDAIVVGAGPAGITAAKEMAAAGLSVVVLAPSSNSAIYC